MVEPLAPVVEQLAPPLARGERQVSEAARTSTRSRLKESDFEFFDKKLIVFRIFQELFVRSNFFHETAWVAAIFLIRKSSNSEPSLGFVGRLKIFNFSPCIVYFTH